MAADSPYDDPKLKGLGRYFNSTTIRGRKNVSMSYQSVYSVLKIIIKGFSRHVRISDFDLHLQEVF